MKAEQRQHLFEALVEFAISNGAHSIKDLPACWEHSWQHEGKRWFLAMHAGPGQRKTSTGAEIPPGEFWLECNGWPAGMVGMSGWTVAAGSVINEDALRAALIATPCQACDGKGFVDGRGPFQMRGVSLGEGVTEVCMCGECNGTGRRDYGT